MHSRTHIGPQIQQHIHTKFYFTVPISRQFFPPKLLPSKISLRHAGWLINVVVVVDVVVSVKDVLGQAAGMWIGMTNARKTSPNDWSPESTITSPPHCDQNQFCRFSVGSFFQPGKKKKFYFQILSFFPKLSGNKVIFIFCSEILSLLKTPQKSQKIEKLIFISDTKGEKQTKKQKKRLSFVSSRCSQPSIFRLARFPTLFGRRRRRRSRSRAAFTRRRASERTNDQDRLEGGFSHRFRGKQHHPQRQRRRRRQRQRQRQRQHQQQ